MTDTYEIVELTQELNHYSISRSVFDVNVYHNKSTCAIYSRQSTPQQKSVKEQGEVCAEVAKKLGFKYAVLFSDKGSGWAARAKFLPGMEALLKVSRFRKLNTLFVLDASRLSRNLETATDIFRRLKDQEYTVYSVLESKNWRIHFPLDKEQLLGEILRGQNESTLKSERLKTKYAHLKAKGHKFGNGKFGYKAKIVNGKRTIVPCKKEMNRIGAIKKLNKTHRNKFKDIAKIMNIRKQFNRHNKAWTENSIKNLLERHNTPLSMTGLAQAIEPAADDKTESASESETG